MPEQTSVDDRILVSREAAFRVAKLALHDGLVAYWRTRGYEPDQEPASVNIDYNVEASTMRARTTRDFLAAAYGIDITGATIADLGCGFGGVGLWFLTQGAVGRLMAYDHNPEFLDVLRSVVHDTGLPGVELYEQGFGELALPDEGVDVAVLLGVVQYSTFGLEALFGRIARALRPGGILVFQQASRLARRDMFTKIAGIHFLPNDAAQRASAFYSPRSVRLETARLLSVYDLVKRLQPAGFGNFRYQGSDGWKPRTNMPYAAQAAAPYYYFGARKGTS